MEICLTSVELARVLGFKADGPCRELRGAAALESATETDLCYVANERAFPAAQSSRCGCLITPFNYDAVPLQTVIRSSSPRPLFAQALMHLYPQRVARPGVDSSAQVATDAEVDASVEIGAFCTVGRRSTIGARTRLGPGCHVGDDVHVGVDCVLHSGVRVYDGTHIGDRAILHSGCVLGADGFGFTPEGGRWEKFPQVGRVEIEDDVEIGANTCVDRAALGRTRIGAGTKLDNLVHVGHNCDIGRNVVIAAQTGISGSVVIGDGTIVGGQVGIGDRARIEAGAVLGSGSGVLTSKTVHAGEPLWGTPARPLKEYLRQLALLRRLPAIQAEMKRMGERLGLLERSKP